MTKRMMRQQVEKLRTVADWVVGVRTVMDNLLAEMDECPWCGMLSSADHDAHCEYRDVVEDYPSRLHGVIGAIETYMNGTCDDG